MSEEYKSVHTGLDIDAAVSRALPGGAISRAMNAKPNPNLLDNWYFGNPVDQRGGYVVPPGTPYYNPETWEQIGTTTTYVKVDSFYNDGVINHPFITVEGVTYVVGAGAEVRGYTGAGYTIDRWKFAANGGVARKTDGGIFFGCIDQTHAYINHLLEISLANGLNGKLCTLSALTVDGNLFTASGVWGVNALIANLGGENLLYNNPGDAGVNLRVDSTGVTLAAAKLELGSEQTLAHQENGVWALNEIPNYAEELAKCQNCYRTFNAWTKFAVDYIDANRIMFSIPGKMRANPVVGGNFKLYVGLTEQSGFAFTAYDNGNNTVIVATKNNHGLTSAWLGVSADFGTLDANL